MSNTIHVTVNTSSDSSSDRDHLGQGVPNGIKNEAIRRLLSEEAKANAAAEVARAKVHATQEAAESRIRDERIVLLAEEEQVRLTARRFVIEAEAKRLAEDRERAIQAEMDRLRNRSKVEILEDKVAELTTLLSSMKTESSRRCGSYS